MKEARPFIACAVLVLLVLGLQLNTWSASYGSIEEFRGANLKEDIFYPLIAKSINDEKRLNIRLNGTDIPNQFNEVHVGKDKNTLWSLDFLRDKLNISASYEDDATVRVIYNGREYDLDLYNEDNNDYVKASTICEITGFTVNSNLEEYQVDISTNGKKSVLPEKYDLRQYNRVAPAMNQGSATTCWAYASILALESSVMPRKADYDVESMIAFNGEASENNAGGAFTNALAYLLSWSGPVNASSSAVKLSGNDADVAKHVQEARFYTHDDREDIKWAVYKYGGVSSSVYANVVTSNINKSAYYNIETNSYCYNGTEKPNYEITIIEWDENYP